MASALKPEQSLKMLKKRCDTVLAWPVQYLVLTHSCIRSCYVLLLWSCEKPVYQLSLPPVAGYPMSVYISSLFLVYLFY